jgi:hypothetical protein
MFKTNQLFGTVGLALQCATFAIYVAFFVVARLEIGGADLPLPKIFIHYIVMPVFLAAILGLIGIFRDGRRMRSITVLTLAFPLLIVMGVLNGSF